VALIDPVPTVVFESPATTLKIVMLVPVAIIDPSLFVPVDGSPAPAEVGPATYATTQQFEAVTVALTVPLVSVRTFETSTASDPL